MPLFLLPLFVRAQFPPVELRSGYAVQQVTEPGRNPVPRDAVVDEVIRTGRIGLSGGPAWKPIQADNEGWFNDIAGGYVLVQANVDQERSAILEATGDSMVYVNGAPRGGDPYAYGYVQTPIQLQKGINTFVFAGGRGRVRARLLPVYSAQQFALGDVTMPDIRPGDKGKLFGAVVVLNNTDAPTKDLSIEAELGGQRVSTHLPVIPPMTSRKVRFDFPVVAGKSEIRLQLVSGGKIIGTGTVNVRQCKESDAYKRTFISKIDGSVQYFAVVPAAKPAATNSLVLSLHGASVEGLGQAQTYAQKDDVTIVCPTNRRPFGFDWEDWGRMDAMEVLAIAKQTVPHDPTKVFLTGHSMGGHGTWSIGSLFPDTFGAIAPSAGWISFASYAGGWNPQTPTDAERVLRQSMLASDTLFRLQNYGNQAVYILHGDKDDNVPVEQAREMKSRLEPWHARLGYHEEPGAGHWWGNSCVDYPAIFETFAKNPRQENPSAFTFVSPSPAISSAFAWITLDQFADYGQVGTVAFADGSLTTSNVQRISISKDFDKLTIDNVVHEPLRRGTYERRGSNWVVATPKANQKSPGLGGPFKNAFQGNMVFVYGTQGSREENQWSYQKARFDAETWYYRGNGAVDVRSDREIGSTRGRNVILYGNPKMNSAFASLVPNLPRSTEITGDQCRLVVYPKKGNDGLVAILGANTLVGMRALDRLPVFTSGVAYPDYVILGSDIGTTGTKGVLRAGFFNNDWQ